MIFALTTIQKLLIIIPLTLIQYAFALVALILLIKTGQKLSHTILWNFLILLVPIVGFSVFFICYPFLKKRSKATPTDQYKISTTESPSQDDPLSDDTSSIE